MVRHTTKPLSRHSRIRVNCTDDESTVPAAHLIMCGIFAEKFKEPGDGAGGVAAEDATVLVPFPQQVMNVIVEAGRRFCVTQRGPDPTWSVERWQLCMPTTPEALDALPLDLPERMRTTLEGAEELATAAVVLNTVLPMVFGVEEGVCCSLLDVSIANLALRIPPKFVPSAGWTAEKRQEVLARHPWFNFLGESTRVDGVLHFLSKRPHFARVRHALCGYAFGGVAVAQVLAQPLRLCVHSLSRETVPQTTATIPFVSTADRAAADVRFNLDGTRADSTVTGNKRRSCAKSMQRGVWVDSGISSIADFLRRPEDAEQDRLVIAAGADGNRRSTRDPRVPDGSACFKGIDVDPTRGLACVCFQAGDGKQECQVFRLDHPRQPIGTVVVTGLSSARLFPGALAITTTGGQLLLHRIVGRDSMSKLPRVLQGSAADPRASAKLRDSATDGKFIYAVIPKGTFCWPLPCKPEGASGTTTACQVWALPPAASAGREGAAAAKKLRNVEVHASPAAPGRALVIGAARFDPPAPDNGENAQKYVSIGWYVVAMPGKRGGVAKRAGFSLGGVAEPAGAPREQPREQPLMVLEAAAENRWVVPVVDPGARAADRDLTCWKPLSNLAAVVVGSAGGRVAVHHIGTGRTLCVIQPTGPRVISLDFSPRNDLVLVGQDAPAGENAKRVVVKSTAPPHVTVQSFEGKTPGGFARLVATVI